MQIKDLAITLELEDSAEPRKKGRLLLGAMTKSQWTTHLRYIGAGHLDAIAVSSIVENLPSDFVFVDIDMRFATTDNSTSLPREKLAASGNGRPGGRGFIRFTTGEQAVQWAEW